MGIMRLSGQARIADEPFATRKRFIEIVDNGLMGAVTGGVLGSGMSMARAARRVASSSSLRMSWPARSAMR